MDSKKYKRKGRWENFLSFNIEHGIEIFQIYVSCYGHQVLPYFPSSQFPLNHRALLKRLQFVYTGKLLNIEHPEFMKRHDTSG